MTIPAGYQPTSYNGNGVTVAFSLPFKVEDTDDVVVATVTAGVITIQPASTYAVTGVGDDDGAVITMVTAPATGTSITLSLDPVTEQQTDFPPLGIFPAENVESALDRITRVTQVHRQKIDRSIRAPDTDSGSAMELPSATERASLFLVFDSNGDVATSSGTGADAGLRQDLADGDANLVKTTALKYDLTPAEIAASVTPVNYSVQNELNNQSVSAARYYSGSGNYAAAVNNAFLVAYQYTPFKPVQLPAGIVDTTTAGTATPILIKNGAALFGAGGGANGIGTWLGNAGATAGNLIQNYDSASFNNVTIKGIAFYGGNWAINVTTPSGQEQLNLEDVAFVQQNSGAIACSNTWQVNNLTNVVFALCKIGVQVAAGAANLNNYNNVQFQNMDGRSILYAGSAQVNNFNGCRFEGVSSATHSTIPVVDVTGTNDGMMFDGSYFEGCHKILLNETAGTGATKYDNCHFTGGAVETPDSAEFAGLMKFVFTSNNVIEFGTNTWYAPSDGAEQMRITGGNQGLLGVGQTKIYADNNKQFQRFIGASKNITGATNTTSLVRFDRTQVDGSLNDLQVIQGLLRICYFRTTNGGVTALFSRVYPITVIGLAGGAMAVTVGTSISSETGGAEGFAVQVTAGPTASLAFLEVAITAIPGTLQKAVLEWSFESLSGAPAGFNPIIASLP